VLPAEDPVLNGIPPLGTADELRRARFESVARAVMPELLRFLRRRADADTADDALSDALLVLWRRFDEVDQLAPDVRLPWCYGVARGCLANARRSAERRHRLWLRVVQSPEARAGATVERDDGGLDGRLDVALGSLRDGDRDVLRLWAWEQLEPREIAVVLEITPNAASIRLHRATKRLRSLLEQEPAVDGKAADGAGHLPGRQDREKPL
jgi:RNA polymerase sigma-70 factor (ECF subfamily)